MNYDYISIEGFLVKQTIKRTPHSFTNLLKKKAWPQFLQNCGLIKLNNSATQKAIRAGCVEYHETIVGKV